MQRTGTALWRAHRRAAEILPVGTQPLAARNRAARIETLSVALRTRAGLRRAHWLAAEILTVSTGTFAISPAAWLGATRSCLIAMLTLALWKFIKRDSSVAICIEFAENFACVREFLGVDDAVVIHVEQCEERRNMRLTGTVVRRCVSGVSFRRMRWRIVLRANGPHGKSERGSNEK